MSSTGNTPRFCFWHFQTFPSACQLSACTCTHIQILLTRVNLEHISSASLIMPAFSMYLAHFELMNLSAVSRAWASSIHWAASLMFPACCGRIKVNTRVRATSQRHSTPQLGHSTRANVCVCGVCYLVNLGFYKEELDERRRTLDGCVDVF